MMCAVGAAVQAKYGYETIVMVGDGATDLEARQPDAANIFIG
jgi:phosphoserine phosphatase